MSSSDRVHMLGATRQMNRRGVARSDPGTDFAQRRRLVARGPVKVRSFDDGEQHTAMYDQHGMHVVVFELCFHITNGCLGARDLRRHSHRVSDCLRCFRCVQPISHA
jgi:hypothetical protein